MVGTRGKGSKSKSKGLVLVPDEPEPLKTISAEAADVEPSKIITAEAADGPMADAEEKDLILNSEVLLAFDGRDGVEQMMYELDDKEENTGFEINYICADGNNALPTNLDQKDQLEGVSDDVDAATNMIVENTSQKTNGEEPEEDMSNVGGAISSLDVENVNNRTNEEAPNGDEDVHTGEEEKALDASACALVDNMTENMDSDTLAENRDGCSASEVQAVADKVIQPKKKIVRKKVIKKRILPTAEEPASSSPKNEGESIKENASPSNEVEAAAENVTQPKKKIVRKKLIKKKILLTAEEPATSPAKNGDESVQENANPDNEVQAVTETAAQPKKKMVRKKLIRNQMLPGNDVTDVNEVKQQHSDGIEGSGVSRKADASDDVKPQSLKDSEATGNTGKLDNTENVNNEVVEGKPVVKKRKLIRKKKPQSQSYVQADLVEQKSEPTNDEPVSKENKTIEQEITNEVAADSKPKLSLRQKRKNKKLVGEGSHNVGAKDIDNAGSSKNGKVSKKRDSMGMIFMCSSGTKNDCFKYNVFGLPAGKKDIVSKIYKGMRLFLFDVDLKMLYGIYKATAPGRLNIEPRAFNSHFPSQVRFTVLEDCVPLAEENFKKIIKDNYYTKTKFDCKLTNEQVNNLCKLFHETTKRSESKQSGQIQRALAPPRVDRKRKREDDRRRAGPVPISSREQERRRKGPEQERHAYVVRAQEEMGRALAVRGQHEMMGRALVVRGQHEMMGRALAIRGQHELERALVVRGREEIRPAPVIIDDRHRPPVVVYERESYRPPVGSSSLYHPSRAEDPPRTRIYSYERDPVADAYRRDSAIDYRNPGNPAPRERHLDDGYRTYREAQVYRQPAYDASTRPAYDPGTRPAYDPGTRRAYDTGTRREHYDYLPTRTGSGTGTGVRYSDYYRSDDGHPPPPLHRRY